MHCEEESGFLRLLPINVALWLRAFLLVLLLVIFYRMINSIQQRRSRTQHSPNARKKTIFFAEIRVKFEIIRHESKRFFNVSLGNIFNTILCVCRGQVQFLFFGKSFLDIFAPGKSLVPQWICSMALCEVHLTPKKNIHGCVSQAIFRRGGGGGTTDPNERKSILQHVPRFIEKKLSWKLF